jgi:translation initiation factor 2B subunit (eIF-2B alpha/beta/delta family)
MMRPDKLEGQGNIATAIQVIREDKEHGASWLARAAARVLVRAGEQYKDASPAEWDTVMRRTAQALAAARPSMAAVANVAARIWSAGQTRASSIAREALLAEAARLAEPDERAQRAMVELAAQRLHGTVYTLSRSGTLEQVLRELGRGHIIERVIAAESRPGGEGIALGRALAREGLPVLIVADAASGVFVDQSVCVTLGADSLRADGSLVNKVGSYPLALVAHQAGKPVYVVSETLKIAAPDFPLELEEKDPTELVPDAADHLAACNPYFDLTPAPLITSYITEDGILDRDAIARRAQVAGDALRRLRAG